MANERCGTRSCFRAARGLASSAGVDARSGFTITETVITLVIASVVAVSLLRIGAETSSFVAQMDTDFAAQTEAAQAFERITSVLRRSGRVEIAGVTYPRVEDGGQTLLFRLPSDSGVIVNTGEPLTPVVSASGQSWDPRVFAARKDSEGEFCLFDQSDGSKLSFLGRHVQSVLFETLNENPSLNLKEVWVSLEIDRAGRSRQNEAPYSLRGSVFLRN